MLNEVKKEETKLTNKEILFLAGGCVASTALLATGFIFGSKYTLKVQALGIQAMWDADPTLKEHMWGVIEKLNKK